MFRVRCFVDPASCRWEYTAVRRVYVEAAWRIHYADHERGRRLVEAHRARVAANVGDATPQQKPTRERTPNVAAT